MMMEQLQHVVNATHFNHEEAEACLSYLIADDVHSGAISKFFERIDCSQENTIDTYLVFLKCLKQKYTTEYHLPQLYKVMLLSSDIVLAALNFSFILVSWPKHETELFQPLSNIFGNHMPHASDVAPIFFHALLCMCAATTLSRECKEACDDAMYDVYCWHRFKTTEYLHSLFVALFSCSLQGVSGVRILFNSVHFKLSDAVHKIAILSIQEVMEKNNHDKNNPKHMKCVNLIFNGLKQIYPTGDPDGPVAIAKLISESLTYPNLRVTIRIAAMHSFTKIIIEQATNALKANRKDSGCSCVLRMMEILMDASMLDRSDGMRSSALLSLKSMLSTWLPQQPTPPPLAGSLPEVMISRDLVQVLVMKCRDRSSRVRDVALCLLNDTVGPETVIRLLNLEQCVALIRHAIYLYPFTCASFKQITWVLEMGNTPIPTLNLLTTNVACPCMLYCLAV
jgi:hypothetical protein